MKPGEVSTTEIADVDFVALAVGQMVGRYEILATLGQGGFGITYRACDTRLNREVAIKEYLPSALALRQAGTTVVPRSTKVAGDFAWGRDRFVAEGQTLANLQHARAIVRVFDYLEANGTAYIVMELLSGETLEHRMMQKGPLAPAEIEGILWPLLDGLEQVHNAGFLHRDIKPANILLNVDGAPTLIDFGASRAAMAGHTTALTAVFTPGYAAAEQFTSTKQGPWSDIYGLAATLYQAITGKTPPSAFDRLLDDNYETLASKPPQGFAPSLLIGIDVALAVRAADRPQSIAGWRSILRQTDAANAVTTVALGQHADNATVLMSRPMATEPEMPSRESRKKPAWIGFGAAVMLALLGGSYYFATAKPPATLLEANAPTTIDRSEQDARAAAEAERLKDQQELAKLRTDAEVRQKDAAEAEAKRKADEDAKQKADAEAAIRLQVEVETRRKIEAEFAETKRLEDEARQKTDADATANRVAEAADRNKAEAAEVALHLGVPERQKIQVGLTSLGFNTAGTDGVFGPRSRETIAAWQKARNYPATGFLTNLQNQALLKEAAPAISKFIDDQKKVEEAKARTTEALSATAAKGTPQSSAARIYDGKWSVTQTCPDHKTAKGYTIRYSMVVADGVLRGQYGTEGAPDSMTLAGQIRADGTATLHAGGFTGPPRNSVGNQQPGTSYDYPVTARFEATRGTGDRTAIRPCTFTFVRL